jgi:AAA lid domain/ATPase family associated with various cellular activities (AAA)
MQRSPLSEPVNAFLDAVTNAVGGLSGRGANDHRGDVLLDANALVLSMIDADDRATDDELGAYLSTFGAKLQPPLITSPAELRTTGLIRSKRGWIDQPSTLLGLLLTADARGATRHGVAYYERALAVAHATAALDLVPSAQEIAAIDRFRSTMLAAFDAAGVPRPGAVTPTPPPAGSPTGGGSSSAPGHDRGTPNLSPTPSGPAPHQPGAVAAAAGEAVLEPPPLEPAKTLEGLLAELDELIGLAEVKAEVRRLSSLLQVQRMRADIGLPTVEISHHVVFTGNPGTGKTTVARLLSQIFRTLGVVSRGHLVETDRSSLVAGFVGQTAVKTKAVLDSAIGGTLLIDEAYALARGGEQDFGREAIDTLVKFMEDHREDLAVVAAGYPAEMADLIDTNPGLKSRFTRTLNFPDYSVDELVLIFERLGAKQQYIPTDGALSVVRAMIASEPRTRGFGNARFVRNLFEAAVAHQAARLSPLDEPSREQLTTLVATDIVPVDK